MVLDDADAVADSPLCGQLDFLLRNAGPALRLVLLTRDDSAVSLPRHRLAGTVTEIGATELAATPTEAVGVSEQQGLPSDVETMDGILRRTRGWMAGLVLTGMALRDPHQTPRAPGEVPAAGDLDEYVDEEVLGAFPPPVRRFLVRTSIADHLPAGLAEELAGQQSAARLLADLARHNAFVTSCEDHLDCYHYHPLLQEVLQARLEEDSPGAGQQLRRRAAAWFLRAGGRPRPPCTRPGPASGGRPYGCWSTGSASRRPALPAPGSERPAWLLAEACPSRHCRERRRRVVRAGVALARQDTIGFAGELRRGGAAPAPRFRAPAAAALGRRPRFAGGLAPRPPATPTTLAGLGHRREAAGGLPPSKELATRPTCWRFPTAGPGAAAGRGFEAAPGSPSTTPAGHGALVVRPAARHLRRPRRLAKAMRGRLESSGRARRGRAQGGADRPAGRLRPAHAGRSRSR